MRMASTPLPVHISPLIALAWYTVYVVIASTRGTECRDTEQQHTSLSKNRVDPLRVFYVCYLLALPPLYTRKKKDLWWGDRDLSKKR